MMMIGEARGEVIEPVRDVLQSGEEDQRRPRAAPVEHFEAHPWRYDDELNSVR